MFKRILSLVLAGVMGIGLTLSQASCRGLFRAAVVGAAVTAHVLLRVALWYAIHAPLYVVTAPRSRYSVCHLPAGSQIYILRYSEDRRWVEIRTRDGRVGWIRADQLRGAQRLR